MDLTAWMQILVFGDNDWIRLLAEYRREHGERAQQLRSIGVSLD